MLCVCALLVKLGELVEIYLVGEVVGCLGCILPSTETGLEAAYRMLDPQVFIKAVGLARNAASLIAQPR